MKLVVHEDGLVSSGGPKASTRALDALSKDGPVPQAEEDQGAAGRDDEFTSHVQRQTAHAAPEEEDGSNYEESDCPGAGTWHIGLEIRSGDELGAAVAWLRAQRHHRNDIANRAAEEKARVDRWAAPQLRKMDDSSAALEARILAYAHDHPEVFGGKKTARFPSGAVTKRKRPEGYRLEQRPGAKADLLAWALREEKILGLDIPLTITPPAEPVVDLPRVKHYLETVSAGLKERQAAPGLEFVPAGAVLEVKTG